MPRTNLDGKPIRRVLEWLLNRDLTDAELATALEMPTTNFHRRKDAEDFPTFHELDRFGAIFNLSARVLQIPSGCVASMNWYCSMTRNCTNSWSWVARTTRVPRLWLKSARNSF